MAEGQSDKTEQATPKKIEDARKKGQVAVSQDLNKAFQMIVMLFLLQLIGLTVYTDFGGLLREYLGHRLTMEVTDASAILVLKDSFLTMLKMLAPFFATLILFMLAINFAQVGFVISTETLKFDVGKLNPVKGIQRIFSLRSTMKLIWSVIKVVGLALVVYLSLKDRFNDIAGLGGCPLSEILEYCFSLLLLILFRLGIALVVLALIDYFYQRWQHKKDLMMTKEEVKEELKQSIGDPTVKRRIRETQLKMLKRRMMEDVPKATVVVTNPTRYAAAIRYDRGEMDAPIVVAKGMNMIAQRIKEIARAHNVPIVENRLLAQSLYRTVEVGGQIPQRLYRAVAELLTYVYKLKNGNRIDA